MAKTPRLPSLDGWRAVSILLVLGAHSKGVVGFPKTLHSVFNWLFDGDLGVRFFFIISGFLITYLLLREYNQNGSINLQKFYIRRALRILPVYFVFLLAMFLLQNFTSWHQSAIIWFRNLTFTTNFLVHDWNWTTAHLWSLAVEEQFYLLWPLLLVLVSLEAKKTNNRTVFYILAIPVVVAPIWRAISYAVGQGINHAASNGTLITKVVSYIKVSPMIIPLFQTYSFLNYFDSLAAGCLAAILLTKHELSISAKFNKFKWESIVLGVLLILVPYILVRLFLVSVFTIPFANTFQAAGFMILLVQSVLSPQLFKPLNWAVVKNLGILSYSIYVWQMIFCSQPRNFGFSNVWFMSFPGWLFAAFFVATLSYYGLEKPLMGLRACFRREVTA